MSKVSVIITAHNYDKYLSKSIESALHQHFTDYEIIVVNDGSTDNTTEVLKLYKDRVKIIELDGVGLARACNIGIKASTGEYIIRLDADDYFDENILLIENNILDGRPNIHMVYPDYYRINQHGEIIDHVRLPKVNDEVKLLDRSPLAAGAMFRRKCFDEIGGYNEKLKYQEDYDFWIKFIEKFNVYNVNLPLMYYRKHDASMSTNLQERMTAKRYVKQKFVEERGYRTKKKVLGFIPATALFRNKIKLASRILVDKPIIAHTIEEAKKNSLFDRIIVSTEDAELADIARNYNVDVPFLRPAELARAGVPMEKVLQHCLDYLSEKEGYSPDIVVILHPSCPLKKAAHITEAIDTLLIHDADSVISVVKDLSFHWKQGTHGLEMTGYKKRLLWEDKETIYKENGAIYAFKAKNLAKGNFLGKKISFIEMFPHESLRLETEYDFWIIEQILNNKKGSF